MKVINFKTQIDRPNFITLRRNKLHILAIFVFQMQHIAVAVGLHSPNYPGNETDYAALLAIKSQLVDHPNGVLSSWNNSAHHCRWDGVICGSKHKRVTILDLDSSGLAGTISPFIGNLSFLKNIYLFNNSLTGQIPQTLGYLYRLHKLRLENNTITGEIPANISRCVNLRCVYLGFNKLEGKLPVELRALSELVDLRINQANLRGPLFDIIQNLTSLVTIDAAGNSFTGIIPNSVGRMRNLSFLSAGENELSGTLPTSIFNLSSLQVLDFQYNQLHGELPAAMGFTIPRLKGLYLASNNFSGSIPNSLSNITTLESINMYMNSFTRRVPQDFGHSPNLRIFDLHRNYLQGDINFIASLVNCSQLNTLAVEENDFYGVLPKSVANLSTALTGLFLGDSLISGILPEGITNLINLKYLIMVNSELTGSLPHNFGKLQRLENVDLHSNRLYGRIPNIIGNLSRLTFLYLHENILEGSIPESIGNCQSMLYLDLHNNHLSGNIPSELFRGSAKFIGISLSQNHLEGSLPFEISKQINLIDLEVSNNKLTREIPDGLSDCTALQTLYLNGNSFYGHVPPSLATLTSLVGIDFSKNHLSGHIPPYLSLFNLTYLNLSYNDFMGSVSTMGVFANASCVFLVGNSRLCGGIQELHLPKCVKNNIVERKKRSLSYSHKKVVISTLCAVVGVLIMSLGLYMIYKRNKRRTISSTLMTGEKLLKVSYDMLLKATAGFSSENILGVGSFGSVFRGILDGELIAVKVLNLQHHGASKSFVAECKALRNVRHRNLVSIITVCSSIDFRRNDFRALVYEFMPKGSLDRWLHEAAENMSLVQRVNVAIDVAHALNYLHHECETPIIHCDLKPSNILLDNDMVAHVGDFGLARFLTQPRHPNHSSSIGVMGTIGYAAPEYGLGSEASIDGDVYSYGILLLELMTGKSPTDNMFKEDYNLHMYAEEAIPDKVLQIVDPLLEEDNLTEKAEDRSEIIYDIQRREECIITVISVGLSCSNQLPHNRMKITDAISRLQSARDNLVNARRRRNLPARGR